MVPTRSSTMLATPMEPLPAAAGTFAALRRSRTSSATLRNCIMATIVDDVCTWP